MVCVGGASGWLGVCSEVVIQIVTEGDRERERDLKVTGEITKEESTESDIKDPVRPEFAPRYFVVVSARVSG